ncbi:MAG: glycosyltransferase [Candidatus Jordarchaeaceae archaeon]
MQSIYDGTNSGCVDVLFVEKPFVVACIPAYNEERAIAKVVVQTKKYVDHVVVCDDGSTDMTAEIAEGLGAECSALLFSW